MPEQTHQYGQQPRFSFGEFELVAFMAHEWNIAPEKVSLWALPGCGPIRHNVATTEELTRIAASHGLEVRLHSR